MKIFKSEGSYQQAFLSKHNDVTAYHSSPRDISVKDYLSAAFFKIPLMIFNRIYYGVERRFFDNKPSEDLTPAALYSLIVTTGLARYVRDDVLDLKYFENIGMPTATIDLDHDLGVATPQSFDKESPNEAMDRAQRACFLAVPLHYHSFVHFHVPTAMAIYSNRIKQGKFRKFLKLHTRYTLVYNNGGINASSSDLFCDTMLPDYSNRRASDSILARVQQYWNIVKQTNLSLPPAKEIANPDNFTMDWMPSLNSDLPFCRKIMSFYPHIRSYVESQNFSEEELNDFSSWFSDNVYPIPDDMKNTVIPLSYLVWSNSVVHSLEHAEYYKWKENARYGPKTENDAWYRYFMNTYTQPYGSMFRNEKLSKYIPSIKNLDGWDCCYVSIQF